PDGWQVHVQRRWGQCTSRRGTTAPHGMIPMIAFKRSTLSLLLGAALLAPAATMLPLAPVQAATTQGAPSQMVLDNSTRVLRTLEERRAEFAGDRAALDAYIATEFNKIFDRDYAAQLVLGRHGRGADLA